MTRPARSQHPQPTPPATPKKPEIQRGDTAGTPRPTAQTSPAKVSDARSAPQRRPSAEQFQMIQTRAYYLWEQAGRPDGDSARETFWMQAEREMVGQRPGA